jgi:mannitol-specific phosphotransferase system IIBC component
MAAPWVTKLFGGLLGKADNIIDEVVTSKEERMTLKNAMQKMLLDSEAVVQENVTERWKADMNSDSWLSKNVRPMVLIFLVLCTMLLVFIDAGFIDFKVEDKWISLLEITLLTVIGAYFGGRSIEKVKNTNVVKNETKRKGLFRKKEEE